MANINCKRCGKVVFQVVDAFAGCACQDVLYRVTGSTQSGYQEIRLPPDLRNLIVLNLAPTFRGAQQLATVVGGGNLDLSGMYGCSHWGGR